MKKIFLLIIMMTVFSIVVGQHTFALSLSSAGSYFKNMEMDMTAGTGFIFDFWQGSNDDHGSQVFVPIQGEIENKTWSFSLFTSYVDTSLAPDGESTRSMSSMTDTKLNIAYCLLDKLPLDMMLGLDFNLPTGKTDLNVKQMTLIMDSDLVSVNTFGEGFNINPTLSLVKAWRQWIGSLGAGAVFRGEYDFSSALTGYDPGDIYNVSTKVDYAWSSRISVGMLVEYAYYDTDQAEGEDYFQEGNFLLIGLAFSYARSDWDASVNLYNVIRGKSKFIDNNVLLTEDKKSNGDEWAAGFSFQYTLDSRTTVDSLLQLVFVNANDYSTESPYYESERKKAVLGCGITRADLYFPSLEGRVFVKGFLLNVDKAWPVMDEDLDYNGLSVSVELTHRF